MLNQEEYEDIKGVNRIRKSKDRQHNDQKKGTKCQATIYKTYTFKHAVDKVFLDGDYHVPENNRQHRT
jgi:hypothetical protein